MSIIFPFWYRFTGFTLIPEVTNFLQFLQLYFRMTISLPHAYYIPHPSEPSSFHYANIFSVWWSVNIMGLYKNFHLQIPFLLCIYPFLSFILKIHYHEQKFPPKPRKTSGRHFDAILIPNDNTRAAVYGSHDLSELLICSERATSAIWCVSCKLWRYGATHTLVPTVATSCKSPFAIRKTSVRRRSMDCGLTLRRGRIVLKSVSTQNSRIRYTRSNSHNAFSRHSLSLHR
jgi:hypothetical protein